MEGKNRIFSDFPLTFSLEGILLETEIHSSTNTARVGADPLSSAGFG